MKFELKLNLFNFFSSTTTTTTATAIQALGMTFVIAFIAIIYILQKIYKFACCHNGKCKSTENALPFNFQASPKCTNRNESIRMGGEEVALNCANIIFSVSEIKLI